jgi:tetratricopeptide (TPR) repeat protein
VRGRDLQAAEAALAEGAEAAVAAGSRCVQARISVLRADIRNMQGTPNAETLAECERAAAVLEAGGDLDGLAEALAHVGKLRYWLEDFPGSAAALERAIACAKQAGNRRVQMRASHWLAVTFSVLPIPVDAAVTRAEQLLRDARGDAWAEADMLKPLCVLYAYQGRFADARAAITRSQAVLARLGAKPALAESAIPAALVGLHTGDPALAERYAREGYQAVRALGERGQYVNGLAGLLAEALYAQGRFDEARQTIEQALEAPVTGGDDMLSLQARLLARDGQFAEARELLSRAEASPFPHVFTAGSGLDARGQGRGGMAHRGPRAWPRPACAPPCGSTTTAGQQASPSG